MFQSPTNRGDLSDISMVRGVLDWDVFQSPTNRGDLSDVLEARGRR